ncbi:uncharacterized protein (DUF952 family) [Paenochrobactrum gallinarii]|uniref:Uncharacterized protein (DUF952 family) n=1 Tax=Paenochrobactrum gallinarii TaxID=643673 RepID=A0A841LVJ3_9HYPH|nr:DUF952 domain-containing protein [Paenochrobactrum gallinarii]MBB6260517.1 uncharacterized protein (DUF952 family) [Paenochrobactrum gallinarii]
MSSKIIYKIVPQQMWQEAQKTGIFTGAPIDIEDGYIHFSTADQVKATAAKHFAGQNDLLLVAVDAALLGHELKYEVSRGGALFPHLYANLDLQYVQSVVALPLGEDGVHLFPEL